MKGDRVRGFFTISEDFPINSLLKAVFSYKAEENPLRRIAYFLKEGNIITDGGVRVRAHHAPIKGCMVLEVERGGDRRFFYDSSFQVRDVFQRIIDGKIERGLESELADSGSRQTTASEG